MANHRSPKMIYSAFYPLFTVICLYFHPTQIIFFLTRMHKSFHQAMMVLFWNGFESGFTTGQFIRLCSCLVGHATFFKHQYLSLLEIQLRLTYFWRHAIPRYFMHPISCPLLTLSSNMQPFFLAGPKEVVLSISEMKVPHK